MEEPLLSIIRTVRAHKGLPELHGISADTHLRRDLGFDSFDLAELTARIEAAYHVDIFAAGVVHTVGEIAGRLSPPPPGSPS